MSDAGMPAPSTILVPICLVDASGKQLHIQAPAGSPTIDIGPIVAGIGCIRFERTDDVDPLTMETIYRQKL